MTTTRTVRHLAGLALTAAALVGCNSDPLVTPEDEENVGATAFEIVIDDGLEYEPQELTVPAGTVVEVRNRSSQAHSVTADDDAEVDFDTGLIAEGETAELVLEEPGRYEYHCRLHPDVMQAVIVVEPA